MTVQRRIAIGLAALCLASAGCGGDHAAPPAAPRAGPVGTAEPWGSDALDRAARTRAIAAEVAARRAELARIARTPTVAAALERALLTGAIRRPEYRRYRAAYRGAPRSGCRARAAPRSRRCSPRSISSPRRCG